MIWRGWLSLMFLVGSALNAAEARPSEPPASGERRAEEKKGEPRADVRAEPKAEAKAEGKAGAKVPFYLLVDHLSPALYEGEPFTACLRVENTTGKEAEAELRAEVLAPEGKLLKEDRRKLMIPAGGQQACRLDLDLNGVQSVRVTLSVAQSQVAGPQVLVLRARDPWPDVKVVDGRLTEAGTGRVLLPLVVRRERKDERSFAPLSWLVTGKGGDQASPRSAFVFLPGAWFGGAKSGLAAELVPEKAQEAKAWAPLGPYALQGAAPVLLAAGDCARGLSQPAPDRVVVVLPPEDLDAATDPRLYRIAVEVLLSRLESAGVREVALFAPILYGIPEGRAKQVEQAAKEATEGRSARLMGTTGFLSESLWLLDPKTPGVYGRLPNEAGRKMIRQALADLIP